MTIQQAIEKAIKGGYLSGAGAVYRSSSQHLVYEEDDYVLPKLTKDLNAIVLDPAFWRALGKTEADKTVFKYRKPTQEEWASNMMHRLIDHLADGGTIESFFATL